MRISEIVARGNSIIDGLNKFMGFQYSERTKQEIIQHINSELSEKIDLYLIDFVKYDLIESFGRISINPHNIFTALLFNGYYYSEAVHYNDTYNIDWGTFSLKKVDNRLVVFFEERPIEEVRELRLKYILNEKN